MAMHPVTFLRPANVVYEELGVSVENLLCVQKKKEVQCAYVNRFGLGRFRRNRMNSLNTGVKIKLKLKDAQIIEFPNVFQASKALQIFPESILEIYLPEPSAVVNLKLSAFSETVRIAYYSGSTSSRLALISERSVPVSDLINEVTYEHAEKLVSRVTIQTGACVIPSNTGTSCSSALPEAALLQSTLNAMTSAGALVQGDPYNGTRLYLNKNIQSQFLPSGYLSAHLRLQMEEYTKRRWTFVVNRTLNPRVQRTGILRIDRFLQPFILPGFNRLQPLNDTQVVINAMEQVFINSRKLTILSKTSTSITVEAKDPRTDLVDIPSSNAFIGFLSPNSGKSFQFNQITSFGPIQPDHSVATDGFNYNFITEAQLANSSIVKLKGSTDVFPVTCCNGVTSRYISETCSSATSRLIELQTYRDTLLAEKATEQNLCTTLSQNLACQAEALPHCNRVTELDEIITVVQSEIDALIQYTSLHCPVGGASTCTVNITPQPCSVLFYGVCWMKESDYRYNQSIPSYQDILNDTTALVSRFEKTIQPIWRPDTTYAVRLAVLDQVGLEEGSPFDLRPSYYTYLFKTKGPIGHFHQFRNEYSQLKAANKEDQFKLVDLRHYIDYSRSYPNADGNLLSAKPLYYQDPKLYLFFKREYVYAMYQGFAAYNGLAPIESEDNKLQVYIKDPSEVDPILIEGTNASWQENTNSILPRDIRALMNLINSNDPCLDIEISRPKGVHLEITTPVALKPQKLYSAFYRSVFEPVQGASDVLSYNFQTSRYPSFEAHIHSYLLQDENDSTQTAKAVYDIKCRQLTSTDYIQAVEIINGTMSASNPLISEFMHPYDRLIDGVLKLKLAPAVHTEFNIIRDYSLGNPSSDYILGILVRSPEPFNDPKIPLTQLEQAIKVILPDGTVNLNYNRVLYSKDISNVFITNETLHCTDAELEIRFDQMNFTKDGFQISSSVLTSIPTPQSVSKLNVTDNGKIEVGFTDVLNAVPVKGALYYQFLIERAEESYSQTYTTTNDSPVLPLGELTGLDYNRTYTVRVKTYEKDILTGQERLSSWGPISTFTTRKLSFVISTATQDYTYVNTPISVQIALVFLNGSRFPYNGAVTLQGTGNPQGVGVINLVDGLGQTTIESMVPGTLTLSLADSDTTGYDVTSQKVLSVIEPATKYEIVDPIEKGIVSTQNFPLAIKIKAVGPSGWIDKGYSKTARLIANGGVSGAGLITFVNGEGTKYISSVRSQLVDLSLANEVPEALDVTDTAQVMFIRSGNVFLISGTPAVRAVNQPVTVNVVVRRADGAIDTTFDLDIRLKASGSVQGDQIVSIQNGIGNVQVTKSTPGNLVLTLEDFLSTGLTHNSTATIKFI
jgi:hypothetical protein